jgi:TrmH family RNA methyltransferase
LPYTAVDWRAPSAIVVGGEAAGSGAQLQALARGTIRIPMAGPAESLNAAMAGAVILFEAARQRSLTAAVR